MKKRLIALYPILYQAKQYSVGDELPTNNNDMTEKWIKGGSAKWDEQSESENKTTIELVTEEYEKKISEMEEKYTEEKNKIQEQYEKEIEKITTEKNDITNKYNELLKVQALGNSEKDDTMTVNEKKSKGKE